MPIIKTRAPVQVEVVDIEKVRMFEIAVVGIGGSK